VGLAIHEAPWLSMPLEPPDLLQPGHVVTIEPGLYYPERGLGVRLEDTVWIGREGPEVLAPYPMDLVLPMRRSQRGQASKPSRSKKTKPRRARPAGRAG
jgi:Xaa-Pro aminopeptidase